MPTLQDVANLANVSTATVSRVLTGQTVHTENKEKVEKAIKELNYKPNTVARNLRRKKSNLIIALMPDVKHQFYSEIIRGIEEEALKAGYNVLIGSNTFESDQELRHFELLEGSQADGIIVGTSQVKQELLEEVSKRKPVVLVNGHLTGSNIPSISIDNERASYVMTKHLLQLQHKRIAHVMGPSNTMLARERLKGYKRALREAGVEFDKELVYEGDYFFHSGYEIGKRILTVQETVDAIYSTSDEMAIGIIRALTEKQIKIPQEISLVGFDDITISKYSYPSLTTIHHPRYEMGKKSFNLLLKLLNNKKIGKKHIFLEEDLVVRESCGAAQST
ncbi:LacI family DNA-binding transcriptional regulator [Metabacillus iocasae]|uniref:LacI family repressor for deo operon, udp, cdd, tsx, nupC, and nupG n=1 Tax=Priestia iocasae TaxID=2291674 RepID=A0ABS2QVP8_9BACI|nr:LacI family DNA-binding transcriptional regulator [Metabacillus iocasae]MBM7703555.1 LacI family repressor for deo operon, udp, cdd, tsx, nupC, and nupG [Metabacillus iocasae]